MNYKYLTALVVVLVGISVQIFSFATPLRESGEIDVIAYPMTIVKSEAEIIKNHEVKMEALRNQLTAFYNREDVKEQVDGVLLNVLKSIKDPNDALFAAQRIAENTALPLEDAIVLVDYADRFEINYSLVLALIEAESDFDKYCVSAAADRGYMQIIPGTEKWLADEFGEMVNLSYNPDRIFESEYQMGLGFSYLNYLLGKHEGYVHKALSEYNKGPTQLERHYRNYGTYESGYSRNVVKRIDKYTFLD